jgi:hypothetical protein
MVPFKEPLRLVVVDNCLHNYASMNRSKRCRIQSPSPEGEGRDEGKYDAIAFGAINITDQFICSIKLDIYSLQENIDA